MFEDFSVGAVFRLLLMLKLKQSAVDFAHIRTGAQGKFFLIEVGEGVHILIQQTT